MSFHDEKLFYSVKFQFAISIVYLRLFPTPITLSLNKGSTDSCQNVNPEQSVFLFRIYCLKHQLFE